MVQCGLTWHDLTGYKGLIIEDYYLVNFVGKYYKILY